MRVADAKRAAALVLAGGAGGLKQKDLESLNANQDGNYNHNKSVAGSQVANSQAGSVAASKATGLRDLASEYDYGNKKKFVDVLGNIKK